MVWPTLGSRTAEEQNHNWFSQPHFHFSHQSTPYSRAEMYAGRVACCTLVSEDEWGYVLLSPAISAIPYKFPKFREFTCNYFNL